MQALVGIIVCQALLGPKDRESVGLARSCKEVGLAAVSAHRDWNQDAVFLAGQEI